MKLKATKKEIKQGYKYILSVSYCRLQHLLNYYSPFAYSTRIEGWSCDYYQFDDVCISTGYSPLKSVNMNNDYDILKEYDTKSINWTKEEKDVLIKEMLNKLKK